MELELGAVLEIHGIWVANLLEMSYRFMRTESEIISKN